MTEQSLILEPGRASREYWRELWRYRELCAVLAWRDVAVRYKQTLVGIAWAILRPLLTMVVFTVVFGKIAGLPPGGGAPYSLMVFAGMLPWLLFASALSGAADSMVANGSLVTKVYFPRMVVPAAAMAVALVDFAIGLVMLGALMLWYGYVPGWRVCFLPLFAVLAVLASVGPGLWISALNVKYRDFRYVIPFLLQLGLYLSPVGFSSAIVPERWRLLYALNPMVGVIDGFRWSLLGEPAALDLRAFGLSLGVIAFILWFGARRFRCTEHAFADLM